MKHTTKLVVLVAAIVGAVGLAAAGWAFWTAGGSGAASGTIGTLNAPTGLSATPAAPLVSYDGKVTVQWTPVTGPDGSTVNSYYVTRTPGPSGGTCASLVTGTQCQDSGVTDGTYTYTVTTVYRSWTELSATHTNTVTVANDTVAPVVTLTSPANGSFIASTTPTFSGTAGTLAANSTHSADLSAVTVNIYAGATATGTPVQTVTTTQSSGNWSVPANALPALVSSQQYTAQASQSDGAGNIGKSSPVTFTVDTTPPSPPTLAFGGLSSTAFYSSGQNTLYVRPAAGGAFTVTGSSTDAESGIKSGNAGYTFSALSGNNFSGTQTAGQNAYTFGASATQPGSDPTVSATNNANTSSGNASYHLKLDTTAPATGGALTLNGTAASGPGSSSTASSTSFTIGVRTDYTEAQTATTSGLASSTLTVQSETLTSGTCGAPGSGGAYTTATVISGTTNPAIATGFCYLYTLTGTDNVGNTTSVSTTVKVDATGPSAPALTFGPFSNAAYNATSSVMFYRPGVSGSFAVNASSTDAESGIASYTFPGTFGAGWTSTPGALGVNTYAWTGTPTTSGTSKTVTATNGVGAASSPSNAFTVAADSTAPSGGALTVNGLPASGVGSSSNNTSGTFTIGTHTDYTETASATTSGLASASLVRDQATLTSGTCGTTWTNATPISGTPTQNSGAGIATGNCYRYTLTGTDNVGNTTSISTTVQVAVPSATKLVLSAASTTPTAGAADNLTITAQDASNNTVASYTGDKSLTFGGATSMGSFNPTVSDKTGVATAFGTATTITFINGVATVSSANNGVMTLYKAETASVTVTDGTINNGTGLSVTVKGGSANRICVAAATSCTGSTQSTHSFTSAISVLDQYGNLTTPSSQVTITISSNGDITGLSETASPPLTITTSQTQSSWTFTATLHSGSNKTGTVTVTPSGGGLSTAVTVILDS